MKHIQETGIYLPREKLHVAVRACLAGCSRSLHAVVRSSHSRSLDAAVRSSRSRSLRASARSSRSRSLRAARRSRSRSLRAARAKRSPRDVGAADGVSSCCLCLFISERASVAFSLFFLEAF